MRRLSFLLALLMLLAATGCEDDPIVGPSTETGGGGSYGKIQQLPEDSLEALPLANPARF